MDADLSTIEFFSLGDLISQAVRLSWRNAPLILQVLLVPAIGCIAGRICMHWPVVFLNSMGWTANHFEIKDLMANIHLLLIGFVIGLVGLIIWFYSAWVMTLRLFALIQLILGKWKQDDVKTFATAYQKIKSMQWAILGVFTVNTTILFVLAFIWLFIIIGTSLLLRLHIMPSWLLGSLVIAEVIAMIVTVILTSMVYWLVVIELILEGEHVKSAILQTWRLAWPNFWRITLFVLLAMLVIVTLTWPLSLPIVIFSIGEAFVKEGQKWGDPAFYAHLQEQINSFSTKVPFYRLVLAQGWETLISLITWPINLFAWALFYKDLKKRALATDLVDKLQDLKTKAEITRGQLG